MAASREFVPPSPHRRGQCVSVCVCWRFERPCSVSLTGLHLQAYFLMWCWADRIRWHPGERIIWHLEADTLTWGGSWCHLFLYCLRLKKKFFLNCSCIRQSEWQWHLYELLHNWCFSLSSSSGCCGGYAVNQPSITYGGALFSSAAVSCGRGYNRGGNIWVSLAQGSKRVRTAPEYSGISLYFLHSLNVLLFAMTGLVFQTENI